MAPVDAAAASLGDDGATSLWFKAEAFAGEHFDADAYVRDLRRYVPLDALRAALDGHQQALKAEARCVDVLVFV